MRLLFILLFITSIANGQTLVPFGGTRTTDTAYAARSLRIDSVVRFVRYGSSDTNKVLGVDAGGKLILRTKGTGGSGVTSITAGTGLTGGTITTSGTIRLDTTFAATQSDLNTVADNAFSDLADTAAAIRGVGYQKYSDTSTFDATRAWVNNRGFGTGSVTSAAIANAFGISFTGSPITTTGTFTPTVDTSKIASVASVNVKQNYSDTTTWDATRSWVIGQIPSVTGYVPYTGATDSVRLGEYAIRAGQFNLDLTPTSPQVVGGMYWDATNVCPSMPLNADVSLQIGEELYVRGRNNTGVTISDGTVVYINSAQGNNPTIAKADADAVNTSQVIGVATEDIGINATGFVTVTGVVNGVNTSGYSPGDALYLDTIAGGLTKQLLPSPHNVVFVGYALNSTNNGRIFVRPSSPIASDTTMAANGNQVAPTQAAVKSYVNKRQLYSDTSTFDATRSWVVSRGYGASTTIAAGTGISVSGSAPTYTVTNTAPDQTVSLTGAGTVSVTGTYPTFTVTGTGSAGGVAAITSTNSTMQVTGTTTVNVEVDTTHPFTFTGVNTFTRDITVDSVVFGTGGGLSTNIKIGRTAFAAPTTATGVVAIGENAGRLVTTGQNDIYIGRNAAGNSGTAVSGHVGIGTGNLNYSTGDNNVAIGNNVMARAVPWNGLANVGVGINAGNVMTTATSNTFIGSGTAAALTSGNTNTFLGVGSGSAMTSGSSNIILGGYSGNVAVDIRTLSNRMILSDGAGNIRAYHNATNWLIGTVTDGSTGLVQISGSLGLNTAGNKINIAEGAGTGAIGTVTLIAGQGTVSTSAIGANSRVMLTGVSTGAPPCATCGTLSLGTITAGSQFIINSSLSTDTRVVQYIIFN
jgi:hypothetical protein